MGGYGGDGEDGAWTGASPASAARKEEAIKPPPWKIGELARHTGISVRALHHYDRLGLLSPSRRTAAGYRLYGADDIARLQQIVALRQVGLSLAEVAGSLRRAEASPLAAVELQLERLERQIEHLQDLRRRLTGVAARLRAAETVSVAELTKIIEVTNMFEKHYTPEQMEQLAARRQQLGEDHIREVEQEWPQLIAAVRAEMERGAEPASEPVQRLARRWMELVREFTGGDPGVTKSLSNLYRQEPGAAQQQGLDPAIVAYVQRAVAAGRGAAAPGGSGQAQPPG
jgi:DNA-binding transcriptional MerR regulator